MLCTKCGKRPASVHVEQRLNGQKMEEYLCEECAEALWGFGTLNLNKVFSSHFSNFDGSSSSSSIYPDISMDLFI